MIAVRAKDPVKEAADDDAAVGLQGHRADGPVGAFARIERRVQQAVGIEPGQTIARDVVHRAEIAAQDDPAVGLKRQRIDRVVRPGQRAEGGVQRTRRHVGGFIINDVEPGDDGGGIGGIDEVDQSQVHGAITIGHLVVQQGNLKGGAEDTRRKVQRAGGGAEVILAIDGGAVLHLITDGGKARGAAGAHHGDDRIDPVLVHVIRRIAEGQRAVGVVVLDRQGGRALATQARRGCGVVEPQVDHLVARHQAIDQQGHDEQFHVITSAGPNQHIRDAAEIDAVEGGAVGGGHLHPQGADAPAQPLDRDYGRHGEFVRHVGGEREARAP